MRIRDTLLTGAGISIILVIAFSLVVYVSFNKVAEENERELGAQEIHQTVSELDIIMLEYLMHREERMLQQWDLNYDATAEIVEKLTGEEHKAVKSDYADLRDLFSKIAANYEEQGSPELEERYVTQFLIKSQSIISDCSAIAKEAYGNAIETQRIANTSMMIALMVLFAALVGISLHTARRITKPLNKLKAGIEIIGKGNLGYKIDVRNKDDIGELALAFRKMAEDLKISRRETKRYAKELEEKVEERTKELNKKVKEITATKTAVLNMMEDADIINRELVEAQGNLKSSLEELEFVDVKKDEFISIAAHELKTPLTAIHGFSQLLQSEKVFSDRKKRDEYLKLMNKETKRLTGMVTDILELSRIDLGTIKLTREKTSLGEIYDTVKKEMTMLAQDKGLKTHWSMDKNMPDIVTDKERVTQVLINLVNNAVKYTEKGSITVNIVKEKGFVRFDIKDTGIGIPEEQFDNIFERFYQIDSSYTRKTKGTGLGLALCKEYVELLGGRIWLESQAGKGTTFHFTLPLKGSGRHISEVEKKARERLEDSKALVKRIGLREDTVS